MWPRRWTNMRLGDFEGEFIADGVSQIRLAMGNTPKIVIPYLRILARHLPRMSRSPVMGGYTQHLYSIFGNAASGGTCFHTPCKTYNGFAQSDGGD